MDTLKAVNDAVNCEQAMHEHMLITLTHVENDSESSYKPTQTQRYDIWMNIDMQQQTRTKTKNKNI